VKPYHCFAVTLTYTCVVALVVKDNRTVVHHYNLECEHVHPYFGVKCHSNCSKSLPLPSAYQAPFIECS